MEALRQKGWHDTTLEYLDWAGEQPSTAAEFKQRIPYERAITLAAQARSTRSQKKRDVQLAEAASKLDAIAKAQPQTDFAIDALNQAANLYYQLASSSVARAEKMPSQASSQKQGLLTDARGSFENAQQATAQLAKLAEGRLNALPKVAQANNLEKALRRQLRGTLAETRFLQAKLSFEMASTYESGSAAAKEQLIKAASAFDELFDEYDVDALVGCYSRFYQGRCYQEAGDLAKAIGCFEDLTTLQTANAKFRKVITRAARHRTECLIEQKRFDEAIADARGWLKRAETNEANSPEWLEVAYRLADVLEAKDKAESSDDNKSDIRLLLRDVSQKPNEFQKEARLRLVGLSGATGPVAELKTFADALAAGRNSLDLMKSSQLAAELAKENNPSAVAELAQAAEANSLSAQAAFETALDLVDSQTPIDDVNVVRYYLCWMYWEQQRLQEAAILGQFLAERYPKSNYQPGGAKVALAAYEKLYNESAGSGSSGYLSQQLASLATAIAERSPESPEASAAVNLLMKIALRDNRLDDAQALLAKLPAGNRAAAQLALGASLWSQYLAASSGVNGQPSAETTDLRTQAAKLLEQGFQGQREAGEPSAGAAAGILYYAQLKLADGDAAKALEVLQDKAVGPLMLVRKKSGSASRQRFIEEVYKTALRATLSAQPPQREQAKQLMTALEATVTGSQAGSSQLTKIYLSLGLQMQQQMKELNAAGKAAQADSVATAFEDVLERVSNRKDADSWAIRNWVAQTNLQLGEGLEGEASERYVKRAKQAYNAILLSAAQDKSYAPKPSSLLAVRKKLADCERALGNYQQALDQYTNILQKKSGLLELQVDAAKTLQQQGFAEKKPELLDQAIRGAKPQANRKDLIWGWLRLAAVADQFKRKAQAAGPQQTARAEQFESLFFEARYNIAKARYQSAQVGPAGKRAAQLASAEKNIQSMKSLYPDLGGPKWQAAFEDLLKRIRNAK